MADSAAPLRTPGRSAVPVSPPTPVSKLSVRVVDSLEGFEALGPSWRELHARARYGAFQSFEWQRSWWRHFAEVNRRLSLHLVVCEEGGRLIAIAPCLVSRSRMFGLFALRQLELVGKGATDYLDVLLQPGAEQGACEALAQYLANSQAFDLLSFVDVPDASPIRRYLLPALAARGWQHEMEVREQCPRTQLLQSWPETVAAFADTHRKRIAYLDRKLKKNFKVELDRVSDAAELDAALGRFIEMHQRRWVGAGQAGAFGDSRAIAFHREVARAFFERGWLALSFLMLDDKVASANYAFELSGKLEFYLSGVGELEAARKFAPGILLHVYSMQQMIENGVSVYDFLRGTERYKYELGAKDVPNWALRAQPAGASLIRAKYRLSSWHRKLGASAKRAMMRARRKRN